MQQRKLESLIEACLNTASGMIIAIILTTLFTYIKNPVLYLGDGLTPLEIVLWTALMTIVSVLRSYLWRRFFARELHQAVTYFVRNFLNEKVS